MSRRDWLTIAQGLLIGLQSVNATLGMQHGNLYVTVGIAAIASAGQYIVHNMSLDTPSLTQTVPAPLPPHA